MGSTITTIAVIAYDDEEFTSVYSKASAFSHNLNQRTKKPIKYQYYLNTDILSPYKSLNKVGRNRKPYIYNLRSQ